MKDLGGDEFKSTNFVDGDGFYISVPMKEVNSRLSSNIKWAAIEVIQ